MKMEPIIYPQEVKDLVIKEMLREYPDRKNELKKWKDYPPASCFTFSRSVDGTEFWHEVNSGNFVLFFERYPKLETPTINNHYQIV